MVKKIASYILVLVLIILLTASTTISILSTTILNKNFTKSMLKKEDYYSKTYGMLMEKFKDNTIQSGLDETILEGIITEEEIESDVDSLIENMYNGTEISLHDESVRAKLREKIDNVIEENHKRVSNLERQEINSYITSISNIYIIGIKITPNNIQEVHNVLSKIQNIVISIGPVLYALTAVLTIIVIILNRKESIKYIAITGISTGILLIIPKIIETVSINTYNIVVLNPVVSNIVIKLIETIMQKFLITGIVICIIGMILNIASSKKINRAKH